METFNPNNFDESLEWPRRKRLPKPKKNNGITSNGRFHIPVTLPDTIAAFRITPSTVTFLLFLMSNFNMRNFKYFKNEIAYSDQEIITILNMSTKTVQRSRRELATIGLKTSEGGNTPGGIGSKDRRTHYKELEFPGFSNGKAEPVYFTIERSTFAFLLGALRNGSIKHRHIVAYLAMRYFEWCARRDRGDWKKGRKAHPDAHHTDFTIDKDKSRALFGMEDTPKLIKELSQIPAADGGPLFKVSDKYQSLRIVGLRDAP